MHLGHVSGNYGPAEPIEVAEKENASKTGQSAHSGDTTAFTFLDYSGLGLILMPIEAVGQRWLEDQPISNHTLIAAATAMVTGGVVVAFSKRCKKLADQPRGSLRRDFEALASKAWVWLMVAALIVFGVPLTVSYVSPAKAPAPPALGHDAAPAPPAESTLPKAQLDEARQQIASLREQVASLKEGQKDLLSIGSSAPQGLGFAPINPPEHQIGSTFSIQLAQLLHDLHQPCLLKITNASKSELGGLIYWVLSSGSLSKGPLCGFQPNNSMPNADVPLVKPTSDPGVLVHWKANYPDGEKIADFFDVSNANVRWRRARKSYLD
jgi:hypothetical protein